MTGERVATTVGVTGHRWRAAVSPWGAVTPSQPRSPQTRSPGPTLDWYIAADDRWHVPATEPAVRQRRIDGAPVVETRVRVPDGDAVQRVWSVATGGGLTIVEFENESPLPFAVACCGLPVVTERPPTAMPIQGIELPADAIVLPVGHRASIRIAIPHRRAGDTGTTSSLAGVPSAAEVARGWLAVCGRAGRLDVPDSGLAEAVVAARCDLMLDGPVEAADDPIGFVLDVGELVRCGEPAEAWLVEIVGPLETIGRSRDPLLAATLAAGVRIAVAAGDRKAIGDIRRLLARTAPEELPVGPFSDVRRNGSAGRFVHDVERRFARGGDLLPTGIPARWFGSNFEVHGVPTSDASSVSYAVRWHGERPAVLWEQVGVTQRLTAMAVDDGWSTTAPSGEALWAAPQRSAMSALIVTPTVAAPIDASAPVAPSASADAASAAAKMTGADDDGAASTSFS